MKAVVFETPGAPEVLTMGEVPEPHCGPEDLRIAVHATAVNRADLLQRRGMYPPPPGASSVLGLEAAGVVLEAGAAAQAAGYAVGQRVMALLAGGGYAEQVSVHHGLALPVPPHLRLEEAAAIPEVFLTAYLNLFQLGGLPFGAAPAGSELSVLIHGGASGVGTAALQLCRHSGLRVLVTVGSAERAARCRELGAHATWNYAEGADRERRSGAAVDDRERRSGAAVEDGGDFAHFALTETGQRGVDLVLDCVGGKYLDRNLRALAMDGRLLCIGLMGGLRAELDLARLLAHRIQIIGSTLRALPLQRKAALVRRFTTEVLPLFDPDGQTGHAALRPVIDREVPISQVVAAHHAMDEHHVGKIVLTWPRPAA